MPIHAPRFLRTLSSIVLIITFLIGCNIPQQYPGPSDNPSAQSPTGNQQTLVTFQASLPQPLPAGDSLYLVLLDEVTGLSFNTHKYIMQAENPLSYSLDLPFTIGKVLKYRYSRMGLSSVDEHLYNDRPVRYRLYDVEGPAVVNDIISRWTDTQYQGPTGRIMGTVKDLSTGQPIPNLLVTAGGEQSLTLADGAFLLESLPPGTHNLVFYAMDGMYHIYQQGASVAADSTTPVSVQLTPAKLITAIFTVQLPPNTPGDTPVRLAGNLYQLGNTFADLAGGVSTLASRTPVMGKMADGRYMLTVNLPEGAYIEYKYTLGDGLWSSELTSKGEFRLRQILIPGSNIEQNDVIDSWLAAGTQPIRFDVSVPPETPRGETVSIQFNPGFGWLAPILMHSVSTTQGIAVWQFNLTGPFNGQTSLHYRYCRQDQCGAADDSATMGTNPTGRELNPASKPGTVKDTVTSWAWLSGAGQPAVVPDVQVVPRDSSFIAGVGFTPAYHPSWGPLMPGAIAQLADLKVNRLILSPTWTFTNNTPPILEPLLSQDMPWPELVSLLANAPNAQFSLGLYPQPNFPVPVDQWWQKAARDYPWWVSFFERYSNFILHHAAIASTHADPFILGGDWLKPALPGGLLSDGTPSNVPGDAETRWRDLIGKVRQRYSGQIAWALSYPDGLKNPPPFLDAVDQVYILWSAPLATQPNAPLDQLQTQAAAILDQEILPFQQQVGKPVILAISYPSIDQADTGCIAISRGGCLSYDLLAPPSPDIPELGLNLQEQANAYNAVLAAINERSWISGFVTMGYYPPAVLQDKSISIHGKPAGGVVLFWSMNYLGR